MIYKSDNPWLDLREYVHLYLKEEITAEAVVRRVDHYARFLDVIGLCSGEELNYQRVADDSGVPPRTVASFVEVLKDTLLAFELEPYRKTKRRKITTKSKIYMFDTGVANYMAGRKDLVPRSEAFGKAFEHFVIQEIRAYIGYHQLDLPMTYWRTADTSRFEVDCIVGDLLAVEIKSSEQYSDRFLTGLKALQEEKKVKRHILVTRDPVERKAAGVEVMHYARFLKQMWSGDLF